MNSIQFVVKANHSGYRLDNYIKSQEHPNLYSRSIIDKLIDSKNVLVNKKNVKKSHQVKENDIVFINIINDLKNENNIKPEKIMLEIVYEDEYLAVINKPSGMTTHPANTNNSGTLVNALLYHYGSKLSGKDKDNNDLVQRPGIVHRLDKDTSGIMIIAKDDKTHFLLSNMFMKREIIKKYYSICIGVPNETSGTISKSIYRSKNDRKKMAIVNNGKQAITKYNIINDFLYFSLLDIEIETGRTHQIRVHLESINHPVLSDPVYNSLKRSLNACPSNYHNALKSFLTKHLTRQALHAYYLSFMHPQNKKEMTFKTDIPKDMSETITFLTKLFI